MSWLSNIGHAVKKGVTDVGHFVGNVATNPWVDAGLAGVLALTGVGIPASAAIMGGTKGLGELIKPGGNLGNAASGGLKGAALGAGASALGGALSGGGNILSKLPGIGSGVQAVSKFL
ncbi:MAG TPA: hypothetical protein VJO33_02775, partial [Gemmatimonadaceae bacterium]|nr:hypothetical protein [Gemmatimonadaceae bacterium]